MPDFQYFFKINDFKLTLSDFLIDKQLKHIWKISDRGLVNGLDFGYPSF